ncbi:MAG TPA: SPOR domain-containing protein [Synergistales bacterium]|nr:hypothetical protein [Synergistaceae bacterium]HPA59542.1 SPOR domain-containing protein [Synergistales bacterium]HQO83571.1 SPOR domain-containing protein [Synergistales bacterium]HQQ11220.1 SPOR domain-containing protein [Synergistales bacterium]
MSFRKNRKFKEKPTVFAFGHIMLPLVAVLALGLLVLGVRLLFVSPESQVSYPETPEYPGTETETPPVVAQTSGETKVVAVPVPNGDGPSSEPKATPSAPSVEETGSAKPSEETRPSEPTVASRGSWIVQIGAFTLKDSAETLARDARSKNYNAFVVQAVVGGKTYYRVRIPAGEQKANADSLARELASKGYPTLVMRQE